jgi:arylsulfatase
MMPDARCPDASIKLAPSRPAMTLRAPLRLAVVCLWLAACAPSDPAREPDGGVARGLFPGLSPAPLEGHAVSPGRPHDILFVVVDALRPDHMGVYGYPHPTTPFLDALAAESYVFLHHSVGAPWTLASTATMLTGLEPDVHGCEGSRCRLRPQLSTLAQDLKRLGYRTGAVVGNLNASSVMGFDRGFDRFIDALSDRDLAKAPTAAKVLERASDWIDAARADSRPWFLFVFLVDPHAPYETPETEADWLAGIEGAPVRMPHIEGRYDEATRKGIVALYDASVAYTDDRLRAFFAEQEAQGTLADATVLLTADHGEAFGEHGFYRHNYHLWNEFVQVPLLIRTPLWKGRGQVFHLTRAVDLRPTLIALAGGDAPEGLPGRDLGALLSAEVDPTRTAYSRFRDFGDHRGALFDLRYRVILELPDDKAFRKRANSSANLPASVAAERVRVFDRRVDPKEQDDLAPDRIPPEASVLLMQLRERMRGRAADARDDAAPLPPDVAERLRAMGYADPEVEGALPVAPGSP